MTEQEATLVAQNFVMQSKEGISNLKVWHVIKATREDILANLPETARERFENSVHLRERWMLNFTCDMDNQKRNLSVWVDDLNGSCIFPNYSL